MSGTQTLRDLVAAIEQVLIGKHAEAELAIVGLAAAGHLLIEDVPGVGKTMLATQNPIEYEGTFPLPEAQLDRFLLRIHLGYPAPAEEANVLQRQMLRHPIEDLAPVTSASELQQLQQAVRTVHVDPQLQRYIV